MSLTGVCPSCGLRAELAVFAVQPDVNRALAAALKVPAPLGGRVLSYLRLFNPPQKVLSTRKAARLLTELAEAIGSAQVTRDGMSHAAPQVLWEQALDLVLGTPPEDLPLKSHGYLFKVVASLAIKGAAQTERRREQQAQAPAQPRQGLAPIHTLAQEMNELINDLRALQTLEAHNPGQHTAEIARLQATIQARRQGTSEGSPAADACPS